MPNDLLAECYGALGVLMAENETLRKLSLELRKSAMCHSVHHCKSEQHELGEPCKVLARFYLALGLETRP